MPLNVAEISLMQAALAAIVVSLLGFNGNPGPMKVFPSEFEKRKAKATAAQ
jgi:hypothetical protein